MKTPLLYLVHRIPYPPNKGDKIRSYHILSYLAKSFDIYLGAFIDNPSDWQYESELEALCKIVHLVGLNPRRAKIKSLIGLTKGVALTIPYYHSKKMQDWVDLVLDDFNITQAVVFSSAMAQYLSGKKYNGIQRVIDFVDVDSDKWAQYGKKQTWPMSSIYARESQCLLSFERQIAKEFDVNYFVSETEARHFKSLAPESINKVDHFNNGVDTDYFSPLKVFENPYKNGLKIVTFTGAMDYWANVDAVVWFANAIFPQIVAQNSNCNMYIIGSSPTEQVKSLGKRKNIIVTGRVPDVRPYLSYADISVAPLRIARGVQNKVLEAMAMSCMVVASPEAAEGISANPGTDFVIADNANKFASACLNLLENPNNQMCTNARRCIIENYSWPTNLAKLQNSLHANTARTL